MFRSLLFGSTLCICSAFPAWADELEAAIEGQLDAFEARDITRAWDFASPMIQERFADPRSFSAMVENGFSTLWNHDRARFGPRAEMEGRARQIVIVTDKNGQEHAFEYELLSVDDVWRINGVWPVEYTEPSA